MKWMPSEQVTRVSMFGYASNETEEYMPYADQHGTQTCTSAYEESVRTERSTYLRPDGKTQVTVEYDEERKSEPSGCSSTALHSMIRM